METVIFIPPLPRMSGGIAVLYQIAEQLRALGMPVTLTSTQMTAPGFEEHTQKGFSVVLLNTVQFIEAHCYLVPEGWPNALAPALHAHTKILVYVQNWAYLLSALPEAVRWPQLPVSFVAVSHPVACFVQEMLGLPLAGIVRPALDTQIFRPGTKPADHIRIAFMPRKNKVLADQIRQISEAFLQQRPVALPVRWVPLHRLSQQEVAHALGESHIFLCTGFPEGFALPPLEALSCGCIPVGFSGFGGWDYMRQSHNGAYLPTEGVLRDVAWSGNGFYASDGDVLGASIALERAIRTVADGGPELVAIRNQGQQTAASYSTQEQRQAIASLWRAVAAK